MSTDTTMTITDIAEAFSGHRFADALPHLTPDARWVLPGASTLEGRDAIAAACADTAAELAGTTTEFTRFVTVSGTDAVAVDVVGRYVAADGSTSTVSSCDVYEFTDGRLTTITSYAVELAQG